MFNHLTAFRLTLLHGFQVFPDALFHQLILAMAHPDPETRVWAHRIFSVVLMPSLYRPWSDQQGKTLPAFLSSDAVSQKMRKESFSMHGENREQLHARGEEEGNNIDMGLGRYTVRSCRGQVYSFKLSSLNGLTDGKDVCISGLSLLLGDANFFRLLVPSLEEAVC